MFIPHVLILSLVNLLCVMSLEQLSANQNERENRPHDHSEDITYVPRMQDGSYLTGAKHRHPGYTSGSRHLDTLSWVVKINTPLLSFISFQRSPGLSQTADGVAADIGLINDGTVGHFPDVYMFTHPHHHRAISHHHYQQINNIHSQTISYSGHSGRSSHHAEAHINKTTQSSPHSDEWDRVGGEWDTIFNGDTWDHIIQDVQERLDSHDSVEWYTRQSVRRRTKRSLHFNDPKYTEQWHLVSYMVMGIWDDYVYHVDGVTYQYHFYIYIYYMYLNLTFNINYYFHKKYLEQ